MRRIEIGDIPSLLVDAICGICVIQGKNFLASKAERAAGIETEPLFLLF